jgi:nitric oxide reductase subunit B
MKRNIAFPFLLFSLVCLITGIFFGVCGGLQYILPEFLRDTFPFHKIRPLHVTLVITWIFTAAVGGIYYYLPQIANRKLYSVRLARIHFVLLTITCAGILISYISGYFGGREYLEFPPVLGIPIIICWILFLINFFKTLPIRIAFRSQSKALFKKLGGGSIYHWMWSTGIIFFLLTTSESYLWQLPFFRDNIVRDMTVQWKALGAMVGSWNMLVYGTGFYIMEKISGDNKVTKSPLTFFFYFLGLVNLMFNWGHHSYIIPASPWIRNVAYIISMTELLIIGNIIYNWRKTLNSARKNFHLIPYRLISAADIWIFLNLILAIIISVPGVNYYTHGTHITVAHAMGSTIGINTMLLLASLYFIAEKEFPKVLSENLSRTKRRFWIVNISLLLFWISMLGAGFAKAVEKETGMAFVTIMEKLKPWFHAFMISGIAVFLGLLILVLPLLKGFSNRIRTKASYSTANHKQEHDKYHV